MQGGALGLSPEAIELALANQDAASLQQLAARLSDDVRCLEREFEELTARRQRLRQDNAGLRSTIGGMIGHLKGSVGGQRAPEPRQPENPLEALGRFWERVRPRSSGILVSEHIGEIRRPAPRAAPLGLFGQRVTELAGTWGMAAGAPLGFAAGNGAWGSSPPKAAGSPKTAPPPLPLRRPEARRAEPQMAPHPQLVPQTFRRPEPAVNLPWKLPRTNSASTESTTSGLPDGSRWETPRATPRETPRTEPPSAARSPARSPTRSLGGETSVPRTESACTESASPLASVLIEATLSLDDVGLAVLRVLATDRCSEVAADFVEEHSLKPCFRAPLTAWLKEAEASAETFPVRLEADLMDIRRRYGSQAA